MQVKKELEERILNSSSQKENKAFAISVEFFSGIFVTSLFGYLLDYLLESKILFTIIFLILGFIVGIVNVYRYNLKHKSDKNE